MSTQCCIVGAGPAGLMLALLLARAGVEVTVLERHTSFFDDFRGDTLQPATLDALADLGLSNLFQTLPTTPISRVTLPDRTGRRIVVADYGRLARWGVRHPFMTLAPQDQFLQLLADAAAQEPTFHLRMGVTVTGLVRDGDTVTGVRLHASSRGKQKETRKDVIGKDELGELEAEEELRAYVVVGCDGRDSPLAGGVSPRLRRFRVPFDTWWFRLPRRPGEGAGELTRATGRGRFAVVIPRPTYFQIGYTARKGTDATLRDRGITAFRDDITELLPRFRDRVEEIRSMDDVRHLDVRLERRRRWHAAGLLVIGDAAHPMSPVGGVGVHLAIQDAIATARILTPTLRRGARPSPATLAKIRRRRLVPTVITQSVQRLLHADFRRTLGTHRLTGNVGTLLRLLLRLPAATTITAYLVGVGVPTERITAQHPARLRCR